MDSSSREVPKAQQATAVGQPGNLVTLTLIIRGTDPALAVQLAEQLLRAAAKSG
jgi:hypothetical protein